MRRCTDITLILDKSDSMQNCHGATIEMLNTFIDERRKDTDECVLSLFQFSTHNNYGDPLTRTFSGLPVKDCPRINHHNYRLHGMTALYDAMGYTIDDVGKRLAALPEHLRPDRVLIVVMTDGQENDSNAYPTGPIGQRMVMDKVNHQRDNYRWEFMFLGADMDTATSERQAQDIGIFANNALNYRKTSTPQAGHVMTQAVANYAGPLGAAGPQGPQGPGIYALDEGTQVASQALRDDADKALANPTGTGATTPPKPTGRKRGKK